MAESADSTCTIWIKHLPEELSEDDKIDLLRHFGAVAVSCMKFYGRLKHSAFASFETKESALVAVKRLHQLEVLGCRLSAELSSGRHERYHPVISDDIKPSSASDDKKHTETANDVQNDKVNQTEKTSAVKMDNISSKIGFQYALDPRLEYIYPAPTVHILTNIANALASVPKFYVQVLHLMNKMNLPAPFGSVTPTPPLPPGEPVMQVEPPLPEEAFPDHLLKNSQAYSSSDESEIGSDNENQPGKGTSLTVKRPPTDQLSRPKKKHKLQHIVSAPKSKSSSVNPTEVFEQPDVSGPKNIEFKLTPATDNVDQPLVIGTTQSTPISGSVVSNTDEDNAENQPSGFGKIEPSLKPEDSSSEEDNEETDWGDSEFIRSKQLRRGRISSSEMRHLSAFKNYAAGEVTTRLYIKNLAKTVTEKDIHFIFGRYVNWKSELEKNMFDIRLMDGRMKGQAFVTLPSEKVAREALHDTHGYELQKKPLVVQYARSAKPKENDPKDKKNRK